MKKRLLSLLLAACLLAGLLPTVASAEGTGTGGTGYQVIAGTQGNSGEGPGMLVDGNINTKWCMNGFSSAYIIFKTPEAMQVGGYAITTGNDNNINPGRNPKDWVLYGCNDEQAGRDSTSWVEIDRVTGDTVLQDENFTTYNFTLANPTTTAYQYFKLEITAIQNVHNTGIMQISEFVLTSCNHSWNTVTVPGTKDELGYTTKTCTICHQEETQYDLTSAMTLVLSNNSGNGWGSAVLQINRDGTFWKELTLENNRNSQTVYLPYSEESDYSFLRKGLVVSDNIVLDILFGIDKVFTSNNLNSVADGALLFQLNTVKIPFTTTVEVKGSVAPGATTFKLALIDNRGNKLIYDGVKVTAAVTTNGADSYEETMTLKGPYSQLRALLGDGVFVQQVDAGEAYWKYDDTVWYLCLPESVALASTDDAAQENTVLIYQTGFEEDPDGSRKYYAKDPVDEMIFTNTYTKSTTRPTKPSEPAEPTESTEPIKPTELTNPTEPANPAEPTNPTEPANPTEPTKPAEPTNPTESNPNNGTTTNPQKGDSSNLTLWLILLALLIACVIGIGVYIKRRRSSQA